MVNETNFFKQNILGLGCNSNLGCYDSYGNYGLGNNYCNSIFGNGFSNYGGYGCYGGYGGYGCSEYEVFRKRDGSIDYKAVLGYQLGNFGMSVLGIFAGAGISRLLGWISGKK